MQDRFLSGSIRIKGQDNPTRRFLKQAQLIFGQGGAHGRDNVLIARLMQGNHIQIAFHDHSLIHSPDCLAGTIQSVKQAALGEYGCFRRIQKLGDVGWIHNAGAKAGHASSLITDRDHDAMAETVIDSGFGTRCAGVGFAFCGNPCIY